MIIFNGFRLGVFVEPLGELANLERGADRAGVVVTTVQAQKPARLAFAAHTEFCRAACTPTALRERATPADRHLRGLRVTFSPRGDRQ